MSHTNQPEYFTLLSICQHTGEPTVLGIFEDMDAVSYRLKRISHSCGDEYRIECFHLSHAGEERSALAQQIAFRAERQEMEEEKEAKLKEYDEWKGQIKKDAELPDIKAAYKTVGVA